MNKTLKEQQAALAERERQLKQQLIEDKRALGSRFKRVAGVAAGSGLVFAIIYKALKSKGHTKTNAGSNKPQASGGSQIDLRQSLTSNKRARFGLSPLLLSLLLPILKDVLLKILEDYRKSESLAKKEEPEGKKI